MGLQKTQEGRRCVITLIHYIVQLIKYYDVTLDEPKNLYSDNLESVHYSEGNWIKQTARWNDGRNIDIQRIMMDLLQWHGKKFSVEHIKEYQDGVTKYYDPPLLANINLLYEERYKGLL